MIQYRKQYYIVLIVNLGFILNGYNQGWSSPAVPILMDSELTPLDEPITPAQSAFIAASLIIGCIPGPYIAGPLSKILGRRYLMSVGSVIQVFGWLLVIFAKNTLWLLAARIIIGVGFGLIYIIGIVYIGDIAAPIIRGKLISSILFFQALGILFAYLVCPYISYTYSNILGVSIAFLVCFMPVLLPESPVDLLSKGNEDEARKVIIMIHELTDDKDISNELEKIKTNLANHNQNKGSVLEIFKTKANRKAFNISTTLAIAQKLSGNLVIVTLVTAIFDAAGTGIRSDIATIIVGMAQALPCLFLSLLIDVYGRKILMMASTIGCAVSMFILGLYFLLESLTVDVSQFGFVPLITLIAASLSYGIGLSSIPETIAGELYTCNVKVIGVTLSTTISWVVTLLISGILSIILEDVGMGPIFLGFSFSTILGILYVIFFLPETKGKTYDEIEEMLLTS